MVGETHGTVRQEADGLQHRRDDHRLEDVELEMALATGERHCGLVADDLAHSMVIASACVGLTLPGMMDEPGSFSGSEISPSPERGPEPIRRISLAILNIPVARLASAPWVNTRHRWTPALELVRRGGEGQGGQLATFLAKRSANSGWAFNPVPTAVPPCARA